MPKSFPFGFCGPSYTAQSPIIDDERAMNCYCENSESESAATKRALLHTPGRKIFCTLPEAKVPGAFTVNGRTFFAVSNLYEVDASGNVTNRGSLGAAPITPTQMWANETQLVVLNNGNLYVLTLATNAFAAVNMAQFNGPVAQIEFLDGYIIATLAVSHTFQVSSLEDATTWSGLDIATLSLFPDNITSMKVEHRYVWFFSAKKAVAYYNAGAGFPPFIPVQGEFLEDGAGAAFATVQLDNTLLWLDQDERGFMVARRLGSGRISTHATELAWQQYAVTSDAVGWTYQEYGHAFWVIYFPTANATWAYDIATGFWHERGFFLTQNGTYIADRAMCHTLNFGIHLVGDWASGNVYHLSSEFNDDFGNPIRGFRRSPTTADDNEWIYFESIEFIMETGLGWASDDATHNAPPQIMLRWSDNGGKTWSNTYYLSIGYLGEYDLRVIKRMLGRARKRVWEVSWTDPVPIRFNDAVLKAKPAAA
jgi:hypothetical protein